MKKVISILGSSALSREQMKAVIGGFGGCSDKTTEATCTGECVLSNGNSGKCGWTIVPNGHCTCAGTGGVGGNQ